MIDKARRPQIRLLTLVLMACALSALLGLNLACKTSSASYGWPCAAYDSPMAPEPNRTTFEYDELGRITSILTPEPSLNFKHVAIDVIAALFVLGVVYFLSERMLSSETTI